VICVDVHEPEWFRQRADVVDSLSAGDFLVMGKGETHLFERKTCDDFFGTLMHRKGDSFWAMLRALTEYRDVHGYRVYLILEGNIGKVLKIHRYPYKMWVGLRRAILTRYYVPIIYTTGMQDTWNVLKSLDDSLENPKEYVRPPPVSKANRSLAECQEDMICSAVDSLGRKKAQALLRHFGSVRRVVTASVDELMSVNGIGSKLAKSLHEVVNEKYGDG